MRINRPAVNNALPAVVDGEYLPVSESYAPVAYRPLPTIMESELSEQLRDDIKKAQIYAASGYFGVNSPEEAYAKMMFARGLGLDEVTTMPHLYPVGGRLAPDAQLMGALVRRQGRYRYVIVEATNEKAVLAFYEDENLLGHSEFTMADAAKAGLQKKDNWQKYPRNMLIARAKTNGFRWYCEDALLGLPYTLEELGIEDVDVIDAEE